MNNTHAKILDCATQLFLLNTWMSVSVREISVLSGVSNTYTHKLFGTKENLYKAVLEHAERRLSFKIGSVRNLPPAEVIDKLLTFQSEPFMTLLTMSFFQPTPKRLIQEWLADRATLKEPTVIHALSDRSDASPVSDMRLYRGLNQLLFGTLLQSSKFLQGLGWDEGSVNLAHHTSKAFGLGLSAARPISKARSEND